MIRNCTFLIVILMILPLSDALGQGDAGIYAYYTRVHSGEEFEKHSRTGEYPDIVIHLENELELVFWRGSSYLPYLQSGDQVWYLDEIIPRSGDGSLKMPDRLNRYSYVRIIENHPDKVMIHWRYIPDFSNPGFTGIVDEYFVIIPGGKLERRIRKGTPTIDEWNDPANVIIQELKLDSKGITRVSLSQPQANTRPGTPRALEPGPPPTADDPLMYFGFNEGEGSSTVESTHRELVGVAGHKSLWKNGVAGFCLQFDGYYSSVQRPGFITQDIGNEMTVEGWVALGAYPFDRAPLVHQSTWEHKGFYLGIDRDGIPGFHIAADGMWTTVESESRLELFRWYYLVGTVEGNGSIHLYVDGEQVISTDPGKGAISLSNSDVIVGLNREKMPAGPGRRGKGNYPSLYGVDGLIDEVSIHGKAKSAREISASFMKISGNKAALSAPDMGSRQWPAMESEPAPDGFGAQYTHLRYYETWDNMWRVSGHTDVVVSFDEIPGKIISWHGLSNGPVLVTENNLWVGDQSSENYKELDAEGEAEGCCEHMSDKQCRHAHIRIIENTPARVVLHYRYGMVDSRYIFPDIDPETGWGDWADEIWTIYPDGVAVRHLERGMIWGDSWVETMFFSAPGQKPEDVVELEAYTVVNEEGESETWSWENGSPDQVYEDIAIAMVNTRSEYRSFNIYPPESSVEVFGGHGRFSSFHWWNHWPASQITSDGRGARASDRAAHSSLVWGVPSQPYLMYGLTSKAASDLIPLSRSWNDPARISGIKGLKDVSYDQASRSYQMTRDADDVEFTFNASSRQPISNICLEIRDWNQDQQASVILNGTDISDNANFRQGIVYDTEGNQKLLIFIELAAEEKTLIRITP